MQAYATTITHAVCTAEIDTAVRQGRRQRDAAAGNAQHWPPGHHVLLTSSVVASMLHADTAYLTEGTLLLQPKSPRYQQHSTAAHHNCSQEKGAKPHPRDEEHHAPGVGSHTVQLQRYKQQADEQQVAHAAHGALTARLEQRHHECDEPGDPARRGSQYVEESEAP